MITARKVVWTSISKASEWVVVVGTVLGGLWAIGQPHAQEFVDSIIEDKGFAQEKEILELKTQLNAVTASQQASDKKLEHLDGQLDGVTDSVDDVKELLKEQRNVSNQILLKLSQ